MNEHDDPAPDIRLVINFVTGDVFRHSDDMTVEDLSAVRAEIKRALGLPGDDTMFPGDRVTWRPTHPTEITTGTLEAIVVGDPVAVVRVPDGTLIRRDLADIAPAPSMPEPEPKTVTEFAVQLAHGAIVTAEPADHPHRDETGARALADHLPGRAVLVTRTVTTTPWQPVDRQP